MDKDKSRQDQVVGDPREAEPGKGASGEQAGVQMAQNPMVNDPEAKIPSNVDVEQNERQLEAYEQQEEGTLPTSHGFVIDESGKIDNFAVEPPMYVEE
jgi:alkyl hydroperoxide reductase subunit AhpC